MSSIEQLILSKFAELNARIDTLQSDVHGLYATLANVSHSEAGGRTQCIHMPTESATLGSGTVAEHGTPDANDVDDADNALDVDDVDVGELELADMMEELAQELTESAAPVCADDVTMCAGGDGERGDGIVQKDTECDIGTHGADWFKFFEFSAGSRVIRTSVGVYEKIAAW